MIEAEEVQTLLKALREGADESSLASVMAGKELARVLPALGIPHSVGLAAMRDAAQRRPPSPNDELGQDMFRYLSGLMAMGDAFDTLVDELRVNQRQIVSAAWGQASELLPHIPEPQGLRLVFLPLGLDFRTYRETVYMDPLAATSVGLEGVRVTLAHEFHHVGRYLLTKENLNIMDPYLPGRLKNVQDVFRDWASWLEAEGIADCVTNVTQTDVPAMHSIVEGRKRQMEEYGKLLGTCMDRIAQVESKVGASDDDLEGLRTHLRNLAHPIGARMAELIQSQHGRPNLRDLVGRPHEFLRSYNALARETGKVEIREQYLDWLT